MTDKNQKIIESLYLTSNFWINLNELLHIEQIPGSKDDLEPDQEITETLATLCDMPFINN